MKLIPLPGLQAEITEKNFLKCIDRGFARFGDSKSRLVFSRFEMDYNLSRQDIYGHPELFSASIRNIFRFGTPYVERAIISELRSTFSMPEREYRGFADAVSEIKKSRTTKT